MITELQEWKQCKKCNRGYIEIKSETTSNEGYCIDCSIKYNLIKRKYERTNDGQFSGKEIK